jgi:hypothetical protein
MTQMLSVALWAFLHGMTVLEAAELFGELKPASSFEFGFQMWIGAAPQKDKSCFDDDMQRF